MKLLHLVFLTAIILPVVPDSYGSGVPHTFTTTDGRSLEATILQHNDRNGKIQIERPDGKKIWTLPTVFTEEDQQYVRQWIVVDEFMSSIKFKISGQSKKDTRISYKNVSGDRVKTGEMTSILYEISLANRSQHPLKDLRLEYRAFIEREGHEGREGSSRVERGDVRIRKIPAGKTATHKLPSIKIETLYRIQSDFNSYSSTTTSYEIKTNEDDLKGIWIRVYGPVIDGRPAMREWCYPSDTKEDYTWR